MSEMVVRLIADRVKLKGCEYVQDLVRCEECKQYKPLDRTRPYDCPKGLEVMPDDFCSHGEYKGGNK